MDLGGGPEVGKIGEALVFPGCADFQPLLYLNGLAEAVVKYGGKIYEHSRVMQTKGKKARALPQCKATFGRHWLPSTSLHHTEKLPPPAAGKLPEGPAACELDASALASSSGGA